MPICECGLHAGELSETSHFSTFSLTKSLTFRTNENIRWRQPVIRVCAKKEETCRPQMYLQAPSEQMRHSIKR